MPDDFNGYGYFFVRLYCTGLGFPVECVTAHLRGFEEDSRQKLSSGSRSIEFVLFEDVR